MVLSLYSYAFADVGGQEAVLINHYLLECSAHLSGVSGALVLSVEVSETGTVLSAVVVSGAPELHEEGLHIAKQLRFVPAQHEGVAIRSRTEVTLQFGEHLHEPDHIENELIIYDQEPDSESTHSQTTLGQEDLEKESALELAHAIDQLPGVHQTQGSGAVAKPIIRGHQERRMLVLFDGIRHEGQKWGLDHGTEIDPLAADRISVMRGAAGARYGSDAIAGVILVESPDMMDSVGARGALRSGFQSNGQRGFGALRLDVKTKQLEDWSFRIEGNVSKGASMTTPSYVLGNTGSSIGNAGISIEHKGKEREIRFIARHYDFTSGIFYGIQNESASEFAAALERDMPPNALDWDVRYDIDRPFQQVRHELFSLHMHQDMGDWGELESIYAYQHNDRKEFDRARDSVEDAQYNFLLRTHSLDLVLNHHPNSWQGIWWEGGGGFHGSFQENVYGGLSLLPNYRSFGGGVFLFERLSFSAMDVEASIRYDALSRNTFLYRLDWDKHKREDTLTEDDCSYKQETQMAKCAHAYQMGALSLGGVYHLIPEELDWKFEVSSASRFPNIDELFLHGTAPSFPVYGLGDPSLPVETTYGASSSVSVQRDVVQAELSVFGSQITNYIYFSPAFTESGELAFDVNIQGSWPRYTYQGIPALFYGVDGFVHLFPDSPLGVRFNGSTVRAYHQSTGEHLIGIPADQVSIDVLGEVSASQSHFSYSVQGRHVFRQSRVDPALDFAPPPEAYTLFDVHFGWKRQIHQARSLFLGIQATNIFNVAYRDYNSLLRYFSHQPGRDLRIHLRLDF